MPESKHYSNINKADIDLFRNTIDKLKTTDKWIKQATDRLKHPKFLQYSIISAIEYDANNKLLYNKGISKTYLKRMQQGKIVATASIDLHGKTKEESCKLLAEFIYYNQYKKYLHIIHGKGYGSNSPQLKNQVFYYLKQHPQVVVICSCPANFGGTGAVFIKLKNV